MKLDPKALDAARYQPGTNHDGIIRAYLTALTPPVAEAVAAEQVDYPRILYVCEHCQESAPEMCGRSRDDIYVTPSGEWLCDECRDEEGVPISDCVSPPALYPASTVARLQQEIQRLVPEEPTEEMLDSGACYEDPDGLYKGNPLYDEGDLSRDVYRAMLSSRPKGGA